MNIKPLHLLPAVSLLVAAGAFAADNPAFDGTTLTIPRVDSPSQAGQFQNAVLQYTPQGTLKLQQVEEFGKDSLYNINGIHAVELKTTGTRPVGVYLQVSGAFSGCGPQGPVRVHQRLQGQRFEVNVSAMEWPLGPVACTANVKTFMVVVPLKAYGLAAGTYAYSVNGYIGGNIVLAEDNRYADDCGIAESRTCN